MAILIQTCVNFCVCAVCSVPIVFAIHELLPARLLSMKNSGRNTGRWLPFHPPGNIHNSGIVPVSLVSPLLAGGLFNTVPPRKPVNVHKY